MRRPQGRASVFIAILAWAALSAVLVGCSASGLRCFCSHGLDRSAGPVAVLPMGNYTGDPTAPQLVYEALVIELLARGSWRPLEQGEVEEAVKEERLRQTDRPSQAQLHVLGRRLGVGVVIVGAVTEFGFIGAGGERIPVVSLSLRLLSVEDGSVLWACNHSRRGDDRETVFGWGKILSLDRLTRVTVKEMMDNLPSSPGR